MQAQVGVAIARALCCFREVPARRGDLRTLGFCSVRQRAAGCPDLVCGAGERQRHTPANFLQAREKFWRVGHRLSVEDLLFSPRYFAHKLPSKHAVVFDTRYAGFYPEKEACLLQIAYWIDMSPPS